MQIIKYSKRQLKEMIAEDLYIMRINKWNVFKKIKFVFRILIGR